MSITTTKDFVSNIQTISERKSAVVKMEEEEENSRKIFVGKMKIETPNIPVSSSATEDTASKNEMDVEIEGEPDTNEDNYMEREVSAGSSVAAALALARQKAVLGRDKHLLGRAQDKKALRNTDIFTSKPNSSDVSLKYLNDDGDEMTPREVYIFKFIISIFRRFGIFLITFMELFRQKIA